MLSSANTIRVPINTQMQRDSESGHLDDAMARAVKDE